MKTRKEQKHPDITWRGHTLVQWYGSARTAELRSNDEVGKPYCACKVTYEKDKRTWYEAHIYAPNLSVEASADDPLVALENAREKILDLAEFLG